MTGTCRDLEFAIPPCSLPPSQATPSDPPLRYMAGKRKHVEDDTSGDDVHEFSPPLEGEQMWTGSIVGEREDAYKIKWDPDRRTGKKYRSTWEPKKNCNEHMVKDWRRRVKQGARRA